MRQGLLFLSFILFIYSLSNAQEVTNSNLNKHHVNLELGGAGVLYSLNYEHLLAGKENYKFLFRVGVSYFPSDFTRFRRFTLPVGGYYLWGKKHHLEIGISACPTLFKVFEYDDFHHSRSYTTKFGVYFNPSIGYRFHNFFQKSVYFGVAYTPVIENIKPLQYFHWARLLVGYSF